MKKDLLIVSAFLVFFGFSITNVCAMKNEEDTMLQDPGSAADMAGISQAPAAPGIPQDLKADEGATVVSKVSTPVHKKTQAAQAQLQSATKATVTITNYCREIIKALNEDRIGDVLVLLDSFYKKIPSTLKNSTRKKHKGQKNDDFKAKLREDALNYHKSLFLCLAMCLKMSVSVEQPDSSDKSENLSENICHNDDYSEISLQVSTTESKTYWIKFEIGMNEISGPGIDKTHEVSIKISILPAVVGVGAIDISGGYKSGNFFKNTTTALVPSSGESRAMRSSPGFKAPAFGDAMSADDVAAGRAAPKVDEALQIKLGLIFNAIPNAHRVYLEQYYHFLIFSLVNFMGSCLCFAEFIAGDGRADLIIRTERDGVLHGSIIELKRGKTSEEALFQITDREYTNSFDEEVQIIGISISGRDEELVTVDCKKQKMAPKPAIISGGDGACSMQITSHIPKPKAKSKKTAVVAAAAATSTKPTDTKRKLAKKCKGEPKGKRSKSSDDSGGCEETDSDD